MAAMSRRSKLALLGLGVLTLVGALWLGVRERADPAVEALFATPMMRPEGGESHPGAWRGRLLLVNFWASWCAPCRAEMPALDTLARENAPNGVEVLGIAWDSADNVATYLRSAPVSYPVLVAGKNTGSLMGGLGNTAGGLPFSVLIDPSGRILARHSGAFSAAGLRAWLRDHSVTNGANMK